MNRSELRGWIEDALARHDRDSRERTETVENVTVQEIVDAVGGRLPLEDGVGKRLGEHAVSPCGTTL